jgi:hypothetical protein
MMLGLLFKKREPEANSHRPDVRLPHNKEEDPRMIKRLLAALLVAALMVLMAAPAMAEVPEGAHDDSPELWTCYTSKGDLTDENLLQQEAIDLIERGGTTVRCESEDGQVLVRTLEGKARMRAR